MLNLTEATFLYAGGKLSACSGDWLRFGFVCIRVGSGGVYGIWETLGEPL